ncbi:MAG: potassium channel protein [Phycisphaerales bacterium]|nr:potassium channel protein [Phycisphaerales bacterium]
MPSRHQKSSRATAFGWDLVVWRSLALLACIVGAGTVGYVWIEGWSAWKSFFFTIVTLSTVGYSDNNLSEAGQRFTAVLMIVGIGAVSYTATSLLNRAISTAAHPERRIMQRIQHMQNHYIVCGLGRTGHRVIERLRQADAQVVAIDADSKAVEHAREHNIAAIEGDASLDETLAEAGVDRAIALAAVTSSDAVNALICLTARALAPNITVIARAEDESSIRKLRRAGATNVVSPASYGGDGVAEHMLHPEVAHLLPGLQGENAALNFAEVFITQTSPHHERTIAELSNEHPRVVVIASRPRNAEVIVCPSPTHKLQDGEVLVVAGLPADVNALRPAGSLA